MMIKLLLSSLRGPKMSLGFKRALVVPANTDYPLKTISEVITDFSDTVGAQSFFSPENRSREHLFKYLPASQSELPGRRMIDSYASAVIPLGQDENLREKYMTFHKTVRVGRLLEDLDVFAVFVCYKHILNPKQIPGVPSPYSIVTALVDQIDFASTPLRHDADIRLRGHVTWVGKTSMEATMEVDQQDSEHKEWRTVTNARFVMVSRDPLNKGSAFINPLVAITDDEKALFAKGEANKERRMHMQSQSLIRQPPSEQERLIIHEQFLRTIDWSKMSFQTRTKPEGSVWMADTKLKNLILCQPENRNRFNKIFGGFLMRLAVELAWANCYVFSKGFPLLVHVDDILFRKPVEIGSLLYFSSLVVYTQNDHIMIRVSAEVVHPESGERDLTNVFFFTFTTSKPVPEVIPRSYAEAMLYLDGRRHFLETASSSTAKL